MFYLIANFKSNLTRRDYEKYVEIIDKGLASFNLIDNLQIVFCPTNLYTFLFVPLVEKYTFVKLGSQNSSPFSAGAYTGETNPDQIKDFCSFSIVGHSERRKYFNENIEIIKEKVVQLKQFGVKPIICVSDPNELSSIIDQVENTLIAFEPVEFVGGVVSAPVELVDNFYTQSSLSQLIYGGSVNMDNFETYLSKKYINGFLVGGFCLNPVDFLKIIQKTNTLLNS